MAETEAPTEPVEATAPAPAPVEDEATPGGDVNTGPAENLREVSVGLCAHSTAPLGVFRCSSYVCDYALRIFVLLLFAFLQTYNSRQTPRPTWKLLRIS